MWSKFPALNQTSSVGRSCALGSSLPCDENTHTLTRMHVKTRTPPNGHIDSLLSCKTQSGCSLMISWPTLVVFGEGFFLHVGGGAVGGEAVGLKEKKNKGEGGQNEAQRSASP